ncbi:hypothetical protein MACJ_001580 [Theileria orientalis]|uniref:Vacuolar protein sorting-associated protein 11 n=1 Tax=Theileria orientalis TaxID=68886 RepID=A0A976M8I2_THEOR|nr:hypothetical protein MACJ_001580 [Theileria orientalis]
MTNLRHLVFLDKKLVSIENRDGTSLNITSIVDVVGDDLFLFLLESSGVVWICYKPWVKFDETTHLRFVNFKSFEFEATNIFYCSLKHILIVIGREQEYDSMLKFNSYDLLTLMNNYNQPPQLIQSTPLFPNLNEFKPESNINIAISECCSIVAISTENSGIYFYKNYIIPSDDHKLYIIPYQKLFREKAGMNPNNKSSSSMSLSPLMNKIGAGITGSTVVGNSIKREEESREYKVEVKKIHLYIIEGVYYLIVVTGYDLVSYNLSEKCLVFKETSEVEFEVSCKLKNSKFAVYKGNKILIYDVVKGLMKQISTSGSTMVEHPESVTSSYGINTSNLINSNNNNNIKLYSFNEYIINCNVDNIFDNNNIILINVYSYLLDITFIAYSYYIPRLVYIVQSMSNLYLFTTNTSAATNKDVLNAGISPNSNILIFELKNKNIYERIEILIKKRLFKWAIKLAEFEKRPSNEVEEIYKIYADWLYTKNRYNESIQCYCRSGSSVEPCYVIQKFLILNSKVYLYKYLYYLHLNNKDNYILTILLIQLLYNINSSISSYGIGNSLNDISGDNNIGNGRNSSSIGTRESSSGNVNESHGVLSSTIIQQGIGAQSNGINENAFSDEEDGLLDNDELGILSDDDIDYKRELYKFLSKFGNTHKKSIKEAIVECRNTNKYEFASLIAKYQNDSQELLNILLEDLQDFRGAYELLKKVERKVQYQAILRHHKILLKHDIDQLLDLICQIFNAENNVGFGTSMGIRGISVNSIRGNIGARTGLGASISATGVNTRGLGGVADGVGGSSSGAVGSATSRGMSGTVISGASVFGGNTSLGGNTVISASSASVSGVSVEELEESEFEIKLDKIINTFILENEFLKRLLEIFDNKNDSLLLYTIRLNLLLQQYYNLTQSNGSSSGIVNTNVTGEGNGVNGGISTNANTNTYANANTNANTNGSVNNEDELLKVEDNILKLLNLNNVSSQNELISLLLCLLYNYKRGSIIMSIKMGYYNLPLILLDNQNDNINLLEYVFNYGYNEPILYINMLKLLLK